MEDAVTMLLDEGIEGNEPEDASNISAEYIEDEEDPSATEIADADHPVDDQLPEHLMENEAEAENTGDTDQDGYIITMDNANPDEEGGIAMADEDVDGLEEDSLNAGDAPTMEVIDDADEPMEMPDGEVSSSEGFAGDEFLSETSSLMVQNEPPHQLMEEVDTPGDDQSSADVTNESQEGADGEDADTDEALFAYDQGDSVKGLQEHEGEGEIVDQTTQDSEEALEEPDESGHQLTFDEEVLKEEPEEAAGEISGEEACEDTDEAEGAESLAILAAGDRLGGAIGGLQGKLVMMPDGSVHPLTQESLQGIQLMEGDDKPEDQAEAAAAKMQQAIRDQLHEALLKQEEIKKEEEEQEQRLPHQDEPNDEGDALDTLASAALDHQAPANGVKNDPDADAPEVKPDASELQWKDVGICKGTHCVVRSFYIPSEGQSWDKNWEGVNTTTLPDHRALAKLELEAGKAYKFRVAAINSCGRGPWSEISAFRTSMPGVPGAPSAIKISKTTEGAQLTWEPPVAAGGPIEDYTVYMAVRTATTDSQVVSSGANQLAFVRIYQGAENQCVVSLETLSEAHIDTATKPAILFRIAARNEKGLGPAIQVRWLQDGAAPVPSNAKPTTGVRRVGPEITPHSNIKRKKSECE